MTLVDRAKNIIFTPKTEWPVIAAEEANLSQIFTGYVIPLALIPAAASLVGFGFVGRGYGASLRWGMAMALMHFFSALVGVFISAYVADILAPNFGSEKNLGRATQMVAHAYTPAWVAGILLIFPTLGILVTLAALYGLYLLYLGLPYMMKTPQDKVVAYLVVLCIVVIVVSVVLGAVLTPVFLGIFGLSSLSTIPRF